MFVSSTRHSVRRPFLAADFKMFSKNFTSVTAQPCRSHAKSSCLIGSGLLFLLGVDVYIIHQTSKPSKDFEETSESIDSIQKKVLEEARENGLKNQEQDYQILLSSLKRLGKSESPSWFSCFLSYVDQPIIAYRKSDLDALLKYAQNCEITINFNPELLVEKKQWQNFLASTHYRNQYETHITGGSSSGKRRVTEQLLFPAYDLHALRPAERPKYGALNILGYAGGSAPYYGPCYFVVKPELRDTKATFTPKDSFEYDTPSVVTTFPYVERLFVLTTPDRLAQALNKAKYDWTYPTRDNGFWIFEAQLHTDLRFDQSFSALVADMRYQHTVLGVEMQAFAQKNHLEFYWHDGIKRWPHHISSSS